MRRFLTAAASAAFFTTAAQASEISIDSEIFVDFELSVTDVIGYESDDLTEVTGVSTGDIISVSMSFDPDSDRFDITSGGDLIGEFIVALDVSASISRFDGIDSFEDPEDLSPLFGDANAIFDFGDPDEFFFTVAFEPLTGDLDFEGAFIQISAFIPDLSLTSDDPVLEGFRLFEDAVEGGDLSAFSLALVSAFSTPSTELAGFLSSEPGTSSEFGFCPDDGSVTFCDAFLSVDSVSISGVPPADPIPLPGAMPLFLAGSALAGFRMRRRRKTA